MIEWDKIPQFCREEFDDPNYPGSGDMMNVGFFNKILAMRLASGWPLYPHGIVGGAVDVDGTHGHAKSSFHLLKMGCKALDFHFNTNASTREQYQMVRQFNFNGIGVYYDWHWFGEKLRIGFHIDDRPRGRIQRWTRRDDEYFYLLR